MKPLRINLNLLVDVGLKAVTEVAVEEEVIERLLERLRRFCQVPGHRHGECRPQTSVSTILGAVVGQNNPVSEPIGFMFMFS